MKFDNDNDQVSAIANKNGYGVDIGFGWKN